MKYIFDKISPTEIRRRVLHMALGPILVVGLMQGFLNEWHLFAAIICGFALSALLRRRRLPVVSYFLDHFDRRAEDWPGRGALTYFIGVLIAWQLFTPDLASAAILILAFGDGLSGVVGPFGRLRTGLSNIKLLEGTLAGALAGAVAASFFVSPVEAAVAALAAMLFEATELRLNQQVMDDNIIVPLVAGTAIVLLRHFGLTA